MGWVVLELGTQRAEQSYATLTRRTCGLVFTLSNFSHVYMFGGRDFDDDYSEEMKALGILGNGTAEATRCSIDCLVSIIRQR